MRITLIVILAALAVVPYVAADEAATQTEATDGALDISDPVVVDAIRSMGLIPYPEPIPSINFQLEDLGGTKRSLGEYRGQMVFLNFWATWCPPCREEMPSMQRLYDRFAEAGLEILAVNSLESLQTASDFIAEFGYTYPVLLDLDGRTTMTYGVRAYPTTYLIDRAGNVLGGRPGYQNWDTSNITEAFETLLSLEVE